MVYKAVEHQMDTLEDLLPGIEEFLCTVLANEALSPAAEEQRQYFIERLDIIKLPPSVPPRPHTFNVKLFPVQEVHTATVHNVPSLHEGVAGMDAEEFAAHQREISRQAATNTDTEESPDQDVKVYDDIDSSGLIRTQSPAETSCHDDQDGMYEIPQLQRSLSDSGYEKAADISNISKSPSINELDTSPVPPLPASQPPGVPPPLPPRKERTASDAHSRSSIGSLLDDKTADMVLNCEFSISSQPERQDNRSEKSDEQLDDTDDFDGTSMDSLDESYQEHDVEMLKKLGIRLPKPAKKKKKHRKLGLSLSSSLWEVTQPFYALEDIRLSGQLHYRSKLSWTRKIVAVTNGRVVCYKRDKLESRPTLVILLMGYKATFHKREGKQNFEIKLSHDTMETHLFLAEFQEWAQIWCEHINAAAEGKPAPSPLQHLARGTIIESLADGTYTLGKSSMKSSLSNLSTASSECLDQEPGTVKVKKIDQSGAKTARMGTFAYKATQFFESLGRKPTKKSSSSSTSTLADRGRSCSSEELSPLNSTFPNTNGPMLPSPAEEPVRHIKHQGYLDVYSSFNKRKWGKRWCMVQDNMFECYRTQTSEVCELEFLLHSCLLRRAVEETKSELGLMLLEDCREKITIEPMSWGELGPWLRVLMKETSTPQALEGLEAYMVEEPTHYHDILESQLSDPFPRSPTTTGVSPAVTEHLLENGGDDVEKQRQSEIYFRRNRDSGNCSAESMDSRPECLEPNRLSQDMIESSSSSVTHSSYSDSSLPRVRVSADHSDMYTQIHRPSQKRRPPVAKKPESPRLEPVPSVQAHSPGETDMNGNQDPLQFDPSPILLPSVKSDVKTKFDFDNPCPGPVEADGSMVDEIMLQFSAQMSEEFLFDKDKERDGPYPSEDTAEGAIKPVSETCDSPSAGRTTPKDLTALDSLVSPVREPSSSTSLSTAHPSHCDNHTSNIMCSTFVESSKDDQRDSDLHNNNVFMEDENSMCELRTKPADSDPQGVQKHSSLILRDLAESDGSVSAKLEELRTKLVQLKKDRICIRDRKHQTSSQTDKDYLEDEFERLNRECTKVSEDIECLEKLTKPSNGSRTGSENREILTSDL